MNTELEGSDRDMGAGPIPTRAKWMIFGVGLLLVLLYWRLIPHVHNYPHAGKELYIGAKLLMQGKNPYDGALLQAASRRYAPEGMVAGFDRQPQIHLPATFAMLVPFSLLPWPLFWTLQVVANAFCIPVIVYLCLCYVTRRPSLWALAPISLFVAFLAPTWQNVVIGQVALPLVLCFLLLARAFARRQVGGLAVLTFFALLKFTFALPLLAFAFWKGNAAQRRGMAAAAAVFVLLNAAAVLRIGPHAFLSGYRTQVARSFGPGGLNDVRSAEGQDARLDLESLLAVLPATHAEGVIKVAAFALLVAAFLYKNREQSRFGLWQVCALSLLTLLLFYHRLYDAVLLLPCLFFGFREWRRRTWMPPVLVALVLISFGAIGNGSHSVVDAILRHLRTTPPPYLHSLLALAVYLTLIFGAQTAAVAEAGPAPKQALEHPEKAFAGG